MNDESNAPDPGLEDMVAERIGAEPETLQLPAQLLRAVMIYELEDGTLSFKPIAGTQSINMDQVMSLVDQFTRRAFADVLAKTLALELRQHVAKKPGPIVQPRFGFRRNQ